LVPCVRLGDLISFRAHVKNIWYRIVSYTPMKTRMQTYRQYCVLIDYENTKHADSDRVSVQTIQEHVYLATTQPNNVTNGNSFLIATLIANNLLR